MTALATQPDLILTLDFSGVIQSAQLNGELAADDSHSAVNQSIPDYWVGKAWKDTCDNSNNGKIERIIKGAINDQVCGYSQINQRLPSGESKLFEFVAVQTNIKQQRIVVLGKNLSAVTKLQNRLLSTQQSMEKEFWKLRELETRYSTLVNANSDAVLVLREPDFKIIDTNEQALRTLGLTAGNKISDLTTAGTDKEKIQNMLTTAKQSGRAPLTLVKIGEEPMSWRVRASSYQANSGLQYVLQFTIHDSITKSTNIEPISGVTSSDIVSHLPEGMVAINQQNIITHVNPAFAALIDNTGAQEILGQPIDLWLQAPDSDLGSLRQRLKTEELVNNFPGRLRNTPNDVDRDVVLSVKRVAGDNTELILMLVRPVAA